MESVPHHFGERIDNVKDTAAISFTAARRNILPFAATGNVHEPGQDPANKFTGQSESRLSVQLSDILKNRMLDIVFQPIAHIGPERIVLELTENHATLDYDLMRGAVDRCRKRGLQIAIDGPGGRIS